MLKYGGGPREDRTPTRGLQSHCAPIITTSPLFGSEGGNRTPTNGFGDRRTAIILPRNCLVGTEGIEPNCRHSAYYGK